MVGVKTISYRNGFSKERITNNDDFCFESQMTKAGGFRLVFTHFSRLVLKGNDNNIFYRLI